MIVIVLFIYYTLGLIITKYLYPQVHNKFNIFKIAFILGAIFLLFYHYFAADVLYLSLENKVKGVFTIDGLLYHESGLVRMNDWRVSAFDEAGWTIAWQYIVASHYYVFGVNTLYPKVFSVLCYALGAIAFNYLFLFITKCRKTNPIGLIFYFSYIPLLHTIGTLMRESMMASLVIISVYLFIRYIYDKSRKYIVMLLFSLFILMITRAELAISLSIAFVIGLIFTQNTKVYHKVIFVGIVLIFFIFISNLPLLTDSEITETIIGEGEGSRSLHISRDESIKSDNYIDFATIFLSNPLVFIKPITFGTISFFTSPLPFKFLGFEYYSVFGRLFFFSVFNTFFIFMLPAFFFGIYLRVIKKEFGLLDYINIIFLIIFIIGISLNMRDPVRYKTPVFFVVLLYTAYGMVYKNYWTRYYPWYLFVLALGYVFFSLVFDIKELV